MLKNKSKLYYLGNLSMKEAGKVQGLSNQLKRKLMRIYVLSGHNILSVCFIKSLLGWLERTLPVRVESKKKLAQVILGKCIALKYFK